MAYVAPDPTAVGTDVAQGAATQVVDTAKELAPIAIPAVLAVAAIKWALRKFGVGGKASFTRV